MSTLENQVAVVTGASSGIGKAIALGLAAQGASLCLVGRNLETLQSVADAAKGKAPRNYCYQADLSVDRELEELIASIKRDVESVDILVHGAGVIWLGALEAATAEQMDGHYKTNVRAPYLLTQGLLPAIKSRRGQILFLNSSAGLTARANVGSIRSQQARAEGSGGQLAGRSQSVRRASSQPVSGPHGKSDAGRGSCHGSQDIPAGPADAARRRCRRGYPCLDPAA